MQEKKQKKEHSQKVFSVTIGVAVLVYLLVGVGWYLLLLKPSLRELGSTDNLKLEDLEQNLQAASRDVDALVALQRKFLAIDAKFLDKLRRAVPNDQQVPELLFGIQSLVDHVGMKIENITFEVEEERTIGKQQKKNDDAKVSTSRLRIQLELGRVGYENLKQFLIAAQSNVRIFDIVNFSYRPHESRATVHIRTFWFPSTTTAVER